MNDISEAQQHAAGAAFTACMTWIGAQSWSDIAPTARRRAALVLADDMAAAFSALDEPEVAKMRMQALAESASGAASVLAPSRPRLPAEQAAAVNGLAMGWNELDEGYRKAVCHAGLYVLPALLACAEAEGASARQVLRALVLGYETAARVARAWRFPAMRIHPHALLAPVGATAGVSLLRGVPGEVLVSAVAGAAATGMAGPFNQALQGALVRNVWAAHGARMGIQNTAWAQCGVGGLPNTPHDVYAIALGATADLDALTPPAPHTPLDEWAIESGYQKMHACCQYVHSSIEAVQDILAQHPELIGGASLQTIEAAVHPLAYGLNNFEPATTLAAKFSLPHAVAAALVHGDGGVASFDAASLRDPRVTALRQRIAITPYPNPQPWPNDRPARITVTTVSGEPISALCLSARGGPDRPYTEAQVWEKIASLTRAPAPAFAITAQRLLAAAAGELPESELNRPWRSWMDEFFS